MQEKLTIVSKKLVVLRACLITNHSHTHIYIYILQQPSQIPNYPNHTHRQITSKHSYEPNIHFKEHTSCPFHLCHISISKPINQRYKIPTLYHHSPRSSHFFGTYNYIRTPRPQISLCVKCTRLVSNVPFGVTNTHGYRQQTVGLVYVANFSVKNFSRLRVLVLIRAGGCAVAD